MSDKNSLQKGVPAGKRNARKHGFYSRVLDNEEKLDLAEAMQVDGIDDEIALLRVKLKSIVRHDPANVALIIQAAESLAKLLRTKYSISKGDKKGLKEAIGVVLRDVAIPLGVDISKSALK